MTHNKNMSPTVINLKESEDIRDVVHRVVQALAEGTIVLLQLVPARQLLREPVL
jgi:hypothetical protein